MLGFVRMTLILPIAAFFLGLGFSSGTAAASACEEAGIVTRQLECYLETAQEAQDPSLCLPAQDPAVRFNCISLYAERSGDSAACGLVEGADEKERTALRGACIAGTAVANERPELCGDIGDKRLADACYLMLVTEKRQDRSLCGKIENETVRQACEAAP